MLIGGFVPNGTSALSIIPLLTPPVTPPVLTQSWTIAVTGITINDPFFSCVDDTLNETVATLLQAGIVAPVMVLALHSGVAANSQTVTVPGFNGPLSTYRIRLAC
jgi:hypothetical protein